jgi:hypothetical protein
MQSQSKAKWDTVKNTASKAHFVLFGIASANITCLEAL